LTPPEGVEDESFDLLTPPEGVKDEIFDLLTPPEGAGLKRTAEARFPARTSLGPRHLVRADVRPRIRYGVALSFAVCRPHPRPNWAQPESGSLLSSLGALMRTSHLFMVCLFCSVALALQACDDSGGSSSNNDTQSDLKDQSGEDAPPELSDLGVDSETADTSLTEVTEVTDVTELEEVTVDPCGRPLADADAPRVVVAQHPYLEAGVPGTSWDVLDLESDGTLTASGVSFEMGRAFWGSVEFARNGGVGIVVQDDGSLGVFRIELDGSITVVYTGYTDGLYAGSVHVAASGEYAYVLDPNWRNNGGGVFKVDIACDGTLTTTDLQIPSKLARGAVALDSPGHDRYFVAAVDILDSPATLTSAHIVDFAPTPAVLSSADGFGDEDASVSAVARTHDGRFALVADNGMFSVPHRVSVLRIDGDQLTPVQTLSPFTDPAAVVTSPYDNAALVVAGEDDALFGLRYDPAATDAPFTVLGELAYPTGDRPQLPFSAVMIDRGLLRGRVLIAENLAIRQVQFNPDGSITDLGTTSLGSGIPAIVGAIGVQP